MAKKQEPSKKLETPQYISKSIALPENFYDILEQLATERMGSIASVIRVIVRDFLIAEGHDVE